MDFIRQKSERPHINITPLVDIIFILLIFFMVSSNFISPNIRMELPKALFEEKLEKVDLVVTADREGSLYINRQKTGLDDLEHGLKEKMVSLGKYDVIFRGDKEIGYELFVTVLDTAKRAGAVSFSVEHETD